MKTKTLKKNKVNVITLGCAKNLYDSEVLLKQLDANNIEASHESEAADYNVVVINTCGFIENAKQESIDTILRFSEAKNRGHVDKVYVTGCLSERYRDDLKEEITNVDAFFGTKELPRLLKTLKADYKKELIGERLLTTPQHFAYFKISEGCDRPCSFCAIPLMRGKHTSIPMEQLVQNAQKLAANGTRELILIAQDSTYYGLDLYKERKLASLMKQLSTVDGIDWIRLHYAFPSGFPEDVLEVMAQNEKVCNYIDIPLQHISDPILKSMKRGTTKDKTYSLIQKIRDNVPDVAIRTTLITGYPGETEEDFSELKDFVKNAEFDRLGVFTYSHEENTGAYTLEDDVPLTLKQERASVLMEMQQEISAVKNQNKVGKTLKILFDKAEAGHFVGRTEHDSPEVDNEVLVDTEDQYVRIGDFANVLIESAGDFDLTGRLV